MLLGIALLILLDVPKPDLHEWFDLRRVVRLNLGDQTWWGITTMISEVGAEVALTQGGIVPTAGEMLPVTVEIVEEQLELSGKIVQTRFLDEFPTVRVAFEQVNLSQHRCLVEMLFCRPGQWKRQETPGELQSLILLFRILLRPRVLFNRQVDVSATVVSKV